MSNRAANPTTTRVETDDPSLAVHTPGPWSQSHRQSSHDGMYRTQVYDANGEAIATCAWYPVKAKYGEGTNREANARLIAAAPDLLASLQECVAALDSEAMKSALFLYADKYKWKGPKIDMRKARAAIAMATGEKP